MSTAPYQIKRLLSLKTAEGYPAFHLHLLGTDTLFTPKPTKSIVGVTDSVSKSYERGETLSYHAMLTATLLAERGVDIDPEQLKEGAQSKTVGLSFKTDSIAVVNGPETFGANIGYRIAESLFLSIEALFRGKKHFQVNAHSRGAVEAVLLMHELERLKKALDESPHKLFTEILADTPCRYTKKALSDQKFFNMTEDLTSHDIERISAKLHVALHELETEVFLVDPVPGDAAVIGWYDPRFYLPLPDFVTKKELIIYRDERTDCFYPIIPDGIRPLVLPGHHGTGSGNRYSQQLKVALKDKDKEWDTTTVQDLLLAKMLLNTKRITKHTGDVVLDLAHPELDFFAQRFYNAEDSKQTTMVLEAYHQIFENDPAYQAFTQTHYAWLGIKQAPNGKRWVHFKSSGYQDLSVAEHQQEGFVNNEHAAIFLRDYISLEDASDLSPEELIRLITDSMEKVAKALKASSKEDPVDSKLSALLKNSKGATHYFNALKSIVDLLGKKYVQNHLLPDEKTILLTAIQKPFLFLSERIGAGDSKETADKEVETVDDNEEVLKRCQQFLQQGLKRIIEEYAARLFKMTDDAVQEVVVLQSIETAYAQAITSLKYSRSQSTDKDEQTLIDVILSVIEGGELQNVLEIERQLQEKLQQFFDRIGDEDIERSRKLRNHLQHLSECFSSILDAAKRNKDEFINDLHMLYNDYLSLQSNLHQLQPLVGEERIQITSSQLYKSIERVRGIAAELLKIKSTEQSQSVNEVCPKGLSETFASEIKARAVAHGAISADVLAIGAEITRVEHQAHAALVEQRIQFEEKMARDAKVHRCAISTDVLALGAEITRVEHQTQAALVEQRTQYEEKMAHDAKAHRLETQKLQKNLREKMAEMDEVFTQIAKGLDTKHQAALQALEEKLEAQMAELKAEHQADKKVLIEKHETQIYELRDENQALSARVDKLYLMLSQNTKNNFSVKSEIFAELAKSTTDSILSQLYSQVARINMRAHAPSFNQYMGSFFRLSSKTVSYVEKAMQVNLALEELNNDQEHLQESLKNSDSKLYKALNLSTIFNVEKTRAVKDIETAGAAKNDLSL